MSVSQSLSVTQRPPLRFTRYHKALYRMLRAMSQDSAKTGHLWCIFPSNRAARSDDAVSLESPTGKVPLTLNPILVRKMTIGWDSWKEDDFAAALIDWKARPKTTSRQIPECWHSIRCQICSSMGSRLPNRPLSTYLDYSLRSSRRNQIKISTAELGERPMNGLNFNAN